MKLHTWRIIAPYRSLGRALNHNHKPNGSQEKCSILGANDGISEKKKKKNLCMYVVGTLYIYGGSEM